MRINMDVCCLNRPFDDQTKAKIRIESDAVLAIYQNALQESGYYYQVMC